MPYTIESDCIACDWCRPRCPTKAIGNRKKRYCIHADLCNNCIGYYSKPMCVIVCPTLHPVPLVREKRRKMVSLSKRSRDRIPSSGDLFPDGKTSSFASSIVIWEACNILAQRDALPWETDAEGKLCYERIVQKGNGRIAFRVSEYLQHESPPIALEREAALKALQDIDIRSACLHLIYAAHATNLDRPWAEEFTITDEQISRYVGLDRRKDLDHHAKLSLIKYLAQQPCQITHEINWAKRGRFPAFIVEESRIWHLKDIEHHFVEDDLKQKHLVGLTFKIQAGPWAQYFLNPEGYKERTAFYQYGILPEFVLKAVMSIWQHREGAARMLLWLLFKSRLGKNQAIAVPTLMRIAYGEDKLNFADFNRKERKKRIRAFENDLEVLYNYGCKPLFDPGTYPLPIQPLWAKLLDIPEDSDAALEFWIDDAGKESRLTDPAPRGKWQMLMNAKLLGFEFPREWDLRLAEFERQKQRRSQRKLKSKQEPQLTGDRVKAARRKKGLSQRQLAHMLEKSQSWVRDIEKGRFEIQQQDVEPLRDILDLEE